MVNEAIDRDRDRRIGQVLDHIAVLKQILALTGIILPEGNDVVNAVEADERIVESFCDLVTMGGNVLETVQAVASGKAASRIGEQSRTDPARVIHDVELQPVPVVGVTCLKIERVEAKDAAVAVAWVEQVGIREEEGGDVLGGDVTSHF